MKANHDRVDAVEKPGGADQGRDNHASKNHWIGNHEGENTRENQVDRTHIDRTMGARTKSMTASKLGGAEPKQRMPGRGF